MKKRTFSLLVLALTTSAVMAPLSQAKDKTVHIQECPAPVQATIKQYSTQGKLEEIGLDEKKKSGGPAVYEVKFTLTDGKRIEVHISPDGRVLMVENKKPKS